MKKVKLWKYVSMWKSITTMKRNNFFKSISSLSKCDLAVNQPSRSLVSPFGDMVIPYYFINYLDLNWTLTKSFIPTQFDIFWLISLHVAFSYFVIYINLAWNS